MIFLLTIIVLAQADGGTPLPVNDAGATNVDASLGIYDTCPAAPPAQVFPDGGLILAQPGDVLMSSLRSARVACRLAACEFDRARRADDMKKDAAPASWLAVTSVAISAGILGFGISRALEGKPLPWNP